MTQAEHTPVEDRLAKAKDKPQSPDDLDMWLLECAADLEQRSPSPHPPTPPNKGLGEELANQKRILRAILDASPVGIGLVAEDRTHVWCNQAMAEISGYQVEELIGSKTSLLIASPEEYQKARDKVLAILDGREQGPLQTVWTRKDGSQIDVVIYLSLVDRQHPEKGCISMVLDLTQQKQIRRHLKQQQRTLKAIFDVSPVGIMWMHDRVMKRVNPAMCQILGYERQQLEGKNLQMLYLTQEDYDAAGVNLQRELNRDAIAKLEVKWLRQDGRTIDVYLQARALDSGRLEEGYIVNAEDITARKLNEKRLKAYQNRLRKLALEVNQAEEQERQRLAETVHDGLGQTLAMIRIGLQSVLAAKPRGRKRGLRELVGLVDRAFQETREITAELSPPVLRDIGLEAALGWLADNTFRRHGVVTHFHSDWKPVDLNRDTATALYRITQELVMNAVKHGRPDLVAINLTSSDQGLQITVQDDGLGFDISLLNNEVHLGFGLFSVSERVKSMGGRLRIGSRPGKGTMAIIALPTAKGAGQGEQ